MVLRLLAGKRPSCLLRGATAPHPPGGAHRLTEVRGGPKEDEGLRPKVVTGTDPGQETDLLGEGLGRGKQQQSNYAAGTCQF